MKKIGCLILVLVFTCSTGYGFVEKIRIKDSSQNCYQIFKSKNLAGYKSLAIALDDPYFTCGISWGAPKMKYAVNAAIEFCEQGRIHPQASMNGIRTIMTHCRIYASERVD